jgi:hypothetical protein
MPNGQNHTVMAVEALAWDATVSGRKCRLCAHLLSPLPPFPALEPCNAHLAATGEGTAFQRGRIFDDMGGLSSAPSGTGRPDWTGGEKAHVNSLYRRASSNISLFCSLPPKKDLPCTLKTRDPGSPFEGKKVLTPRALSNLSTFLVSQLGFQEFVLQRRGPLQGEPVGTKQPPKTRIRNGQAGVPHPPPPILPPFLLTCHDFVSECLHRKLCTAETLQSHILGSDGDFPITSPFPTTLS